MLEKRNLVQNAVNVPVVFAIRNCLCRYFLSLGKMAGLELRPRQLILEWYMLVHPL